MCESLTRYAGALTGHETDGDAAAPIAALEFFLARSIACWASGLAWFALSTSTTDLRCLTMWPAPSRTMPPSWRHLPEAMPRRCRAGSRTRLAGSWLAVLSSY